MRPNISSAAHYRGAGGDYSCRQGHEQTFQGFMGSNFEKGVSLIFLDRVGRVSLCTYLVMNVEKIHTIRTG